MLNLFLKIKLKTAQELKVNILFQINKNKMLINQEINAFKV